MAEESSSPPYVTTELSEARLEEMNPQPDGVVEQGCEAALESAGGRAYDAQGRWYTDPNWSFSSGGSCIDRYLSWYHTDNKYKRASAYEAPLDLRWSGFELENMTDGPEYSEDSESRSSEYYCETSNNHTTYQSGASDPAVVRVNRHRPRNGDPDMSPFPDFIKKNNSTPYGRLYPLTAKNLRKLHFCNHRRYRTDKPVEGSVPHVQVYHNYFDDSVDPGLKKKLAKDSALTNTHLKRVFGAGSLLETFATLAKESAHANKRARGSTIGEDLALRLQESKQDEDCRPVFEPTTLSPEHFKAVVLSVIVTGSSLPISRIRKYKTEYHRTLLKAPRTAEVIRGRHVYPVGDESCCIPMNPSASDEELCRDPLEEMLVSARRNNHGCGKRGARKHASEGERFTFGSDCSESDGPRIIGMLQNEGFISSNTATMSRSSLIKRWRTRMVLDLLWASDVPRHLKPLNNLIQAVPNGRYSANNWRGSIYRPMGSLTPWGESYFQSINWSRTLYLGHMDARRSGIEDEHPRIHSSEDDREAPKPSKTKWPNWEGSILHWAGIRHFFPCQRSVARELAAGRYNSGEIFDRVDNTSEMFDRAEEEMRVFANNVGFCYICPRRTSLHDGKQPFVNESLGLQLLQEELYRHRLMLKKCRIKYNGSKWRERAAEGRLKICDEDLNALKTMENTPVTHPVEDSRFMDSELTLPDIRFLPSDDDEGLSMTKVQIPYPLPPAAGGPEVFLHPWDVVRTPHFMPRGSEDQSRNVSGAIGATKGLVRGWSKKEKKGSAY